MASRAGLLTVMVMTTSVRDASGRGAKQTAIRRANTELRGPRQSSVSNAVVHHSDLPVLVVPDAAPEQAGS